MFAITQVTTLFADRPGWGRFGESMLILALVWWAWSAFVWAANAQAEDSGALRAYLLVATVLIFIVGLALPQAYGREGALFAGAYTLVRLVHLAVYIDASRRGSASWSAIVGFALTVTVGMVILLVGAVAAHGWHRAALWALAAAIDYSGPAWLTRERLRGLQRVAVAHFAERYALFVLICIGESVVALGVGVGSAGRRLTAELVLTAGLALATAIGMWWSYFARLADEAMERLRHHDDPVLAAADAYSYLHLIIVAGIIIYAGGVKLVVHRAASAPMPTTGRLALCGGVARLHARPGGLPAADDRPAQRGADRARRRPARPVCASAARSRRGSWRRASPDSSRRCVPARSLGPGPRRLIERRHRAARAADSTGRGT